MSNNNDNDDNNDYNDTREERIGNKQAGIPEALADVVRVVVACHSINDAEISQDANDTLEAGDVDVVARRLLRHEPALPPSSRLDDFYSTTQLLNDFTQRLYSTTQLLNDLTQRLYLTT